MTVYSHSRLSTYEDCPLKYKLSYIDGIKRETEGIEAFTGTAVHETLQKCYDDLKYARLDTIEDLLAFYRTYWQKNWRKDIIITRKELTAEHYRARGEKMLTSYHQRHAPFDADVTIGTEMNVSFPLDAEGKYRLTGKIDRLAKARDGIWAIHDYKTSARLPTQENADNDKQLTFYHIGVQTRWPDVKSIRLVWHYLDFDERLVSSRTPAAIKTIVAETVALIGRIESTSDFLPRESALCPWCEYPDLCPKRKHFHMVEALPVNEYLKEPGVELVNKYAELKEAEKALGEQLDLLKEAIVAYGAREAVEIIKGSGHKVRITETAKLKFPGKNDPERSALDSLIKQANKWDEVSALDTNALAAVIENERWSGDLADKVKAHGQYDVTKTVRLSKLKEEAD